MVIPIHCFHICVCCTDGTAKIFTAIPLFYLSCNKSPVSRVTSSHWERASARGGGTQMDRSTKNLWVWTPAACMTGECFIHCALLLGLAWKLKNKKWSEAIEWEPKFEIAILADLPAYFLLIITCQRLNFTQGPNVIWRQRGTSRELTFALASYNGATLPGHGKTSKIKNSLSIFSHFQKMKLLQRLNSLRNGWERQR